MALTESSLLCHEVLDVSDLQKTPPPNNNQRQQIYPEMPPTVKAVEDLSQLRDDRVLQNLLRNEEKYLPVVPDYMRNIQTCITPSMRKIVADWMLEVVHEQNSQPEVFYLAMNIVDRFLCRCRIMKSQLQLLGTVAILISSKIREPCPIPGKTLITYTDYSITADELKEWELLVLYKLQWEITAITPLDYLDHVLPRLCLGESVSAADLNELRRRTETILVLCATEYKFAYHSPSLLAASSILTALESLSLSSYPEVVQREIKLRLQTATHTATGHTVRCMESIDAILPTYLKAKSAEEESLRAANKILLQSPDSTTNPVELQQLQLSTPTKNNNSTSPDLACAEVLSSAEEEEDFDGSNGGGSDDSSSTATLLSTATDMTRSGSPLSAVDIFTDFNTNVLQVYEDHEGVSPEEEDAGKNGSKANAKTGSSTIDQTYSILVS